MALIFEEGTKPIETVVGDLVAFVGRSSQGPCMDARLVTSPGQYSQIFGGAGEGRYLYHAVQGFFSNGGVRCYVLCLGEGSSAIEGLEALGKTADETLSLVAFPGRSDPAEVAALAKHLDEHRAWFGLLDGPAERPGGGLEALPVPAGTPWASMIYPWVMVQDLEEGALAVPASGHLAGVIARRQRESGLDASPAGQLLRGVLGVTDTVTEKEFGDKLTPRHVNAVREIKAKGYHVWGESTLAADDRLRTLTVARRHLILLRSIEIGTRWVLKREDKPALRARLKDEVDAYLERVRAAGHLSGADAAASFAVDVAPRAEDGAGAFVFRVSLAGSKGDKLDYEIRHAR